MSFQVESVLTSQQNVRRRRSSQVTAQKTSFSLLCYVAFT